MTEPTPSTAAAVAAGANALKAVTVLSTDELFDQRPVIRLDDNSEYWNLGGVYSEDETALARLVLEAAAPVLLAAQREQIAREIEARAAVYDSQAADGLAKLQLCPDEADDLNDTARTLRRMAALVRGGTAGGGDGN